jgi:hypothetical protein
MGAGGVYVLDDQEQAIYGAGFHIHGLDSKVDGACRTGRSKLHEANLVADPMVYVHTEADLLDVERLRAVHIGDGDSHHFYLPIHSALSFRAFVRSCGRSSRRAR